MIEILPENLSYGHQESRRKILRTLTLLLVEAVHDPDALQLAYSIGDGYFFHFGDKKAPMPSEVHEIKEKMTQRIKNNAELVPVIESRENINKVFKTLNRQRSLGWLEDRGSDMPVMMKVNKELFAFDGDLCKRTGDIGQWDLISYPPGILLRLPPNGAPTLPKYTERPTLFRSFYSGERWGKILGTSYVHDVNNLIREKKIGQLIQTAESMQERTIAQIADNILSMQPRPQVVLISGPSSSGKTSFSMRLSTHLRLLGLNPHPIGLDDYYLPREEVPKTADGEYDFEALEALDIELFNETLLRLISLEEVQLPKIDFKTHKRAYGRKIKLKPESILVVEGIHGLNPKLTHHLTAASAFKVYVSALTHLNLDRLNRVSTTDLRLLRRLVRDRRSRGYDADDTIFRWPAVRKGELKHIFPYQEEADMMFNSALPYELNALKEQALVALADSTLPELKEPVRRLKELLLSVESLDSSILNQHLPPTSILREFTGGSVLVS